MSKHILKVMDVDMCKHSHVLRVSPFPPSSSFLTESLGSGSDCGDDTLEAGVLALL